MEDTQAGEPTRRLTTADSSVSRRRGKWWFDQSSGPADGSSVMVGETVGAGIVEERALWRDLSFRGEAAPLKKRTTKPGIPPPRCPVSGESLSFRQKPVGKGAWGMDLRASKWQKQ